jgi:hypothetical protein
MPGVEGIEWRTGIVKTVVFCVLYAGVLLVLERDLIPMLLDIVRPLIRKRHFQPRD